MEGKQNISPLVILLIVVTSTLIMLLAVRATREILSPIILAVLLSITLSPLIEWFKRRGIPVKLATWLTIAVIAIIILGFVALVSLSALGFADTMSNYGPRFERIGGEINQLLSNLGLQLADFSENDSGLTPQGTIALAANVVGGFIEGVSDWALILVITILFLRESTNWQNKIQRITEYRDPGVQRYVQYNREVREYMTITAGLGFVASALEVALLAILGVEFALLWGIFSFIASFVPRIGIYFALIPPALMAYVQFGVLEALAVVFGYLVIDGILNRMVKRRFFQRRLNISILAVFISLVLWTWALGPVGAILAVPIAMLVQTLLGSREETSWIAYLLSGGQASYVPEAENASYAVDVSDEV